MMDKILFVVNPIAGGGRSKKIIDDIKDIMDESSREYNIVWTMKAREGIRLSRKGIEKGFRTIVAVGGDGTVNEIALGILEAGKGRLGIIPSGTGNDLARSLNIPFSIEGAIKLILEGEEKYIDIGIVNNKLFLNIASIGFDAEVVRNTQMIKKKIKSSIAYTISVIYTFINFKNRKISLEVDGELVEEDAFLVAIGNGRYYGGGIPILPRAFMDDGYLHICIIKDVSKLIFLRYFLKILKGRHEEIKSHVSFLKAKNIKVTTKGKTYLNVDGEIYDIKRETLFTISDEKIGVYC